MINPQEVNEIFCDCLYREAELQNGELPEDAIKVEGIVATYNFNPVRVEKYKSRIIALLLELPIKFRQNSGGGWSFLNACDTKDGKQWTGLHLRMEQLFVLGMAIGKVEFVTPRRMWSMLPGGMPYLVIKE